MVFLTKREWNVYGRWWELCSTPLDTQQYSLRFYFYQGLNIYFTYNDRSSRSAALIAKSREWKDSQTTSRFKRGSLAKNSNKNKAYSEADRLLYCICLARELLNAEHSRLRAVTLWKWYSSLRLWLRKMSVDDIMSTKGHANSRSFK